MRAGETPPAFLLEMMLMNNYNAKKCLYNGTWYKSMAEGRTAMSFDKLGIKYEYESYANLSSDYDANVYTPDFFLPELDIWVEVAGRWDDYHPRKAATFFKNTGMKDHRIVSIDDLPSFIRIDAVGKIYVVLSDGRCESGGCVLNICRKCKRASFLFELSGWECPICHAYDGDHYIDFYWNLFEAAGIDASDGKHRACVSAPAPRPVKATQADNLRTGPAPAPRLDDLPWLKVPMSGGRHGGR